MKPSEKKPETVFRIINRESGSACGSYSRAFCDEYDFRSAEEARGANCHGMFEDQKKYKIAKYRVTYELIEDDVPTPDKGRKPSSGSPWDAFEKSILDALNEAILEMNKPRRARNDER